MRKIREMLRLRFEEKLSNRAIARSIRVSPSTVSDLFGRFAASGLTWPLPTNLNDAAVEALLYPGNPADANRPEPNWQHVHVERRRKGVTLQLLWLEYKAEHPDGYQYSQFCERYRRWAGRLNVVLRQVHRAGEKMFVDYAGVKVMIMDRTTGKVRHVPVFVAVLGASNYTFCEVTESHALPDWIGSHCRAFEFFRGVTEVVVPDNVKTAAKEPSNYEPDLNPTYHELAVHYGTVVIPARPKKPRDKAKVETGVQTVERWVLAPLRNQIFFSLDEANAAMRECLDQLNERPFQKLPGSRRTLFETLDRPALKPLPPKRFEFAEWRTAKVDLDYHISVDKRYYSVPYQLVDQQVDVRLTATTVEVLHRGQRVASHRRANGPGQAVTDPSHRPAAHQRHLEWTPSRLIAWGEEIGPETKGFVERLMAERPHPEQGYRSCLGLMKLGRHYGPERLEAACSRALASGALSYRSVKSILNTGLDRLPLEAPETPRPVTMHENVRGAAYYQSRQEVQ